MPNKKIVRGLFTLVLFLSSMLLHAAPNTTDETFPAFQMSDQTPGRIEVGPQMGVLVDASKDLGFTTENWEIP